MPSGTLSLSSSPRTGIRISPLQFSSLRPKTQKQTEMLCRLDRGAPQLEPKDGQGIAVPSSLGAVVLFEDTFNSAECFSDRRQGHGKSVDGCKEIPFKE